MQKGWSWAYAVVVQDLCWPLIKRDTPSMQLALVYRLVGLVARIGHEEAGGNETSAVPMLRTHIAAWLNEEGWHSPSFLLHHHSLLLQLH